MKNNTKIDEATKTQLVRTVNVDSNGAKQGLWLGLATDKLNSLGLNADSVDTVVVDGVAHEWAWTSENGKLTRMGLTLKW